MECSHVFRWKGMAQQMDVHKGVDRVALGKEMRRDEVAPTSMLEEYHP
jgi:hypothetical protein